MDRPAKPAAGSGGGVPDPAAVATVAELRAALARVRAAADLSLTEVSERSAALSRRYGDASLVGVWGVVPLSRKTVSGFTTGSRPQLPSERSLITLLLVCGIGRAALPDWVRALHRVRRGRQARHRPTLPRLPGHFVPRLAERRAVLDQLRRLAAGRGTLGLSSTAALHGTGGFGKTTVALDVSHQDEVHALFPDGVVWVEVGQEPVLTVLLADATAMVTGLAPVRYGTVEAAAVALADALGERRVLLVLDNVWRAADLEPFLLGGRRCVRLVTSRRSDVLPAACAVVSIERMAPETAVDVLRRDLPGLSAEDVYPLYERSHRWPVVLGLLNGILLGRSRRSSGQPMPEIVAELAARIDRLGLAGADDLADGESRTVRDVLTVGIEELAAGHRGPELRERYLSLAAFPPDQLIPFATLEDLWVCDRLESRVTCDQLADRSLLSSADREGVRLHDVVRDHLLRQHHPAIRRWSQALLDLLRAHAPDGQWHRLDAARDDELDLLAFLLVSTDQEDELRGLMFDLRYLSRRILQGGTAGLLADLHTSQIAAARDPQQAELERAIALEGHLALRVTDAASVAATLYSRTVSRPVTASLITHAAEALSDSLTAAAALPDRADGRLLRVLGGHSDRVLDSSWQPSGDRLATAAADGTIRVWDSAGTLQRVAELGAAANAVEWSPDQLHLAVLAGTDTVVLVEPLFGEIRGRYTDRVELTAIAWSPHTAELAIGRADGSIVRWNLEGSVDDGVGPSGTADRGAVRLGAVVVPSAVRALDWTAEAGLVAAYSNGTVARPLGEPPTRVDSGQHVPRTVAARPGGSEVAVAGASSGVLLADLAGSRVVATSAPTDGWVTSAAWSAGAGWLAAGLQDGAVTLWTTVRDGVRAVAAEPLRRQWEATFATQPRVDHHGYRVAAVGWHPAQPWLTVSAHTEVRIYDVERPFEPAYEDGVNCLHWRPGHRTVAAGGTDGQVLLISADDPTTRHSYEAHPSGVRCAVFSSDGQRLMSVSEDGPLLVWRVGAEELHDPVPVPSPVAVPGAVAWSPAGDWVAVGGNREIAILDPRDWTVATRFPVSDLVNRLDVDPSGARIAVATSGSRVTVRTPSGEHVDGLDDHLSSVSAVRWVEGGGRLASAGYDGQVILWRVGSAEPVATVDPGDGAVWDVAAHGSNLLTVTSVGMLGLHDADTRRTRCRVAMDTALSSCVLSEDGRTAVVAGSAGVALFRLPADGRPS